jgi:hypothetical protein
MNEERTRINRVRSRSPAELEMKEPKPALSSQVERSDQECDFLIIKREYSRDSSECNRKRTLINHEELRRDSSDV